MDAFMQVLLAQFKKLISKHSFLLHFLTHCFFALRLISVICEKGKYIPAVGDVILGRILAVENKRWKLDINSTSNGLLSLTNINLTGLEQRIRSEEDELLMREYFKEGDLLCAEVHSIHSHNQTCSVHTRNLKYGKVCHFN
jgi:exosome complex component RRP4